MPREEIKGNIVLLNVRHEVFKIFDPLLFGALGAMERVQIHGVDPVEAARGVAADLDLVTESRLQMLCGNRIQGFL